MGVLTMKGIVFLLGGNALSHLVILFLAMTDREDLRAS
jgi:hypothetical protein